MLNDFQKQIKSLGRLLVVFALLVVLLFLGILYIRNNSKAIGPEADYEVLPSVEQSAIKLDEETIANSGFVDDKGVSSVIQHCTPCHSAKLVTQNRMSRDGWETTITWMKETQNLWDLGDNHESIVDYLAKNYAPERKGRRQKLTNIEWYELK